MVRIVALAVVGLLAVSAFGGSGYEAEYRLPASEYRLVVSLDQTHPYLAEYERQLRVLGDGRQSTRELFPDTGGYAVVNVYRTSDSRFVLRTMGNHEYVVDGKSGRLEDRPLLPMCDQRIPSGGTFVGAFDFDAARHWRFIPANERQEPVLWACDKDT